MSDAKFTHGLPFKVCLHGDCCQEQLHGTLALNRKLIEAEQREQNLRKEIDMWADYAFKNHGNDAGLYNGLKDLARLKCSGNRQPHEHEATGGGTLPCADPDCALPGWSGSKNDDV